MIYYLGIFYIEHSCMCVCNEELERKRHILVAWLIIKTTKLNCILRYDMDRPVVWNFWTFFSWYCSWNKSKYIRDDLLWSMGGRIAYGFGFSIWVHNIIFAIGNTSLEFIGTIRQKLLSRKKLKFGWRLCKIDSLIW